MVSTAKLAVFDVDGTLVDSRQAIHDAARISFEGMGLPAPEFDAVRQIVGLSLPEGLGLLAKDLAADDLAQLVQRYREAFYGFREDPAYIEPLYDGAADTLARLQAEGWRLAIATGKSRRGVASIVSMHGWEDLFHSTHCAEDGPGKPDPAMLLAAIAANGATPGDAIMIGDTSHDVKMALAANVHAQGVAWGFHTFDEVAAAGAHHVATDFADLDRQLTAFRGA